MLFLNITLSRTHVNLKGEIIVPFEYSSIFVKSDSDYLEVTKDAKISKKGFAHGYFNPKRGLINFENEEVLPIIYKYIGTKEGAFLQVENFDSKRAIFNLETKEFETDFIFENFKDAQLKLDELKPKSDRFIYHHLGLKGLKSKEGGVLISPKYEDVSKTSLPDIYQVIRVSKNEDDWGCYGYFDITKGKEIVPTNYWERGGIGGKYERTQKNVIVVMDIKTDNYGLFRTDGFQISEPIYDEFIEGFAENLAPVRGEFSGYKTGVIDIEGNLIYDYIFDEMTLPLNGKAIAKYNGKVGIVNLKN